MPPVIDFHLRQWRCSRQTGQLYRQRHQAARGGVRLRLNGPPRNARDCPCTIAHRDPSRLCTGHTPPCLHNHLWLFSGALDDRRWLPSRGVRLRQQGSTLLESRRDTRSTRFDVVANGPSADMSCPHTLCLAWRSRSSFPSLSLSASAVASCPACVFRSARAESRQPAASCGGVDGPPNDPTAFGLRCTDLGFSVCEDPRLTQAWAELLHTWQHVPQLSDHVRTGGFLVHTAIRSDCKGAI